MTSAEAGYARLSSIATHWMVHPETARTLLADAGAAAFGGGAPLYRWRDVWSIEKAGIVPRGLYEAYQAAMIPTAELGRNGRGLIDLGPSAIRHLIATGALRAVTLSPRIRRIRPCDLDDLLVKAGPFRSSEASTGQRTPGQVKSANLR